MAHRGGTVLVTGAGSGPGRLAARNHARAGCPVVALDEDAAALRGTAEGFPEIRAELVDLTDPRAIEAVVARADANPGPIGRVYATAAEMPLGAVLEQDAATFHRVMGLNYGGMVNAVRAVLPAMLRRGRGDLVLFASIAGWVPSLRMAAYGAAEAAVLAFAEILYHENRGRGVRFACACPPPPLRAPSQPTRRSLWTRAGPLRPGNAGAREIPDPQEVLDAVEAALERGEFWVFPGRGTRRLWRLRRLLPERLWRTVHRHDDGTGI